MGRKDLAVLTRVFVQENEWLFCPAAKIVDVKMRSPYYRGGHKAGFQFSSIDGLYVQFLVRLLGPSSGWL